jgi:hypothetical protein
MLDATKPEEAMRRQSMLDRASDILSSPDAAGRMSMSDKETLAEVATLRKATGPSESK